MPPENTQTPPAAPETVTPPQGNQRNDSVTASRIRDVVGRSNLGAEFALELISRNEATPLTEAQLTDAIMERLAGARPQGQIDGGNSVGPAGTEDESYRRAIETAVILRSNPSADVSTEDRENAREFRGMTLMEMGRDYLQRTGIAARGLDRLQLAGAALGMRSGALTTSDFAHALSNAANRRLRSAFEAAPQTFGGFVSRGTLPDFKEAPIVAFGDTPQLLLVKENGEFKRGSLADTGDSYKLATYGRIIPITRQCIVNDDLRVFDRIPAGFGRQAADLESDLVYAQLTGNPKMYDGKSLFHADHGNLAATGTAITEAALSAGEAAIMEQKSAEGGFLNLRPQFLIVGTAKKVEAQKILAAITATKSGDVNVFQNALTLVVDPRVAGKQWFLSVSPDAFDTIELANLEGQEGVYTETRVGFDVDGIEFKGRVDRVAKAIDWRGLYKNSGD